jgi:hypothetical protein
MSSRTFFSLLVATVLVYLCFMHAALVIRGICFLVSIFSSINAYCYLEHAVLFRNKWKTAESGKRRTPPGQSIIVGSIFLLLAIASMIFCFIR